MSCICQCERFKTDYINFYIWVLQAIVNFMLRDMPRFCEVVTPLFLPC